MSDGDWKPGDLALCVRGGSGKLSVTKVNGIWHREASGTVRKGAVYTVRHVKLFTDADPVVLALGFDEVDGPWLATRFCKINPLTEEERDEEIRLLTGKPVREPVQ